MLSIEVAANRDMWPILLFLFYSHLYVCVYVSHFFSFYCVIFFLPHFPYLSNTYITAITDVMILLLVLMSLTIFFRTNLLSSSILFFIFKLQRFCTSLVFLYYLNYIILLLIIASCVVVYVTLPVHYILFLYISFFVRAINIIIQIFHDFSVY